MNQLRYLALASGERAGELLVEVAGAEVTVTLHVDNNGRGAKHVDHYRFDDRGFPIHRSLVGTSMVGAPVSEEFSIDNGTARWRSPADSGECPATPESLYLSCENNAYSVARYVRLGMAGGGTLPVLPYGRLGVARLREVRLSSAPDVPLTAYQVSGLTLVPVRIVLDADWLPVVYWDYLEDFLRTDFLGTDLRATAEEVSLLGEDLAAAIARQVGQLGRYQLSGPVRIGNVRILNPARGSLGELSAVTIYRDRIAVIERAAQLTPADPGLAEIDGEGGVLVPGLHDMHGHISVMSALLYTTIGVTEVRDMGNNPEILERNMRRWQSGELPGPAVDCSGFIEGAGPYSAKAGRVVDSLAEGIEAVRWYARRGYRRIKIYNSIPPDWVPSLAAEARRLGLETLGHLPAFSTPAEMIRAGYREITHINQLMLSWLLRPGEDPRTPARVLALVRAKDLDLATPEVEELIGLMRAEGIGLDTTLMVMEELLRSRPGIGLPDADYLLDRHPVGYQRQRKLGVLPIPADQADDYYRAYDTLLALVAKVYRAGISIWPGTDQLYSYTLQRELELYVLAGLSPAEALRTATIDAARRLGTDAARGSIEAGKIADFFLVPGNPLADIRAIRQVRLVVQAGRCYSPAHLQAALGITPWTQPPPVRLGTDSMLPSGLSDGIRPTCLHSNG